jgi:uncharacterized protein (TIGR02646 family)
MKGAEPASLTAYRFTADASYNDYRHKQTLRDCLVGEQRGLCCYCLSRIRPEIGAMRIEHWHSQHNYPSEQLDYSNLLGACMGNEGQSWDRETCDKRKGERDLSRNPANPMDRVEDRVRFTGDGRILSDDLDFGNELNDVLNLNEAFLVNNRKETLEAFKATLIKRGNLSRQTLERWLREWNGETDAGQLRPFCQVVIYWLRKRLARA